MTLASMTRENLARSSVEGLLCLMAACLEAVTDLGVEVGRVTMVGGGARSVAVRKLSPAVLGVPVEVPAPSEDVADGAARQAAWVLSGADHPPAWQGRERITFTATPTPHVVAAYRVAAARVAQEFR